MAYDHKEQESSENRISEVELNDALADLKQSLLINDNPRSEEIQEDEQSQESETIIDQIKDAVVGFLEFVGLLSKEEEKESLMGDLENSQDIDKDELKGKLSEFVEGLFDKLGKNNERNKDELEDSLEGDEQLEEQEQESQNMVEKMMEALLDLLENLGIIDRKEKESLMGDFENSEGMDEEALEAFKDKVVGFIDKLMGKLDNTQEIQQDGVESDSVSSPFKEEQIVEPLQQDDPDIDSVSSPLHKEPEVLISKSSVQDAALEGEDDIVQDQYYAKEMVLEELKAALSNNKPDSGSQDQDTNSLPTKENEGHSR